MPTALVDVFISIFNHVYEASYLRYSRAVHGGAFWNGGDIWALWPDIFLKTFPLAIFDLSPFLAYSFQHPGLLRLGLVNEGGGCAGYFFQRRFMKAHLKREEMRR